MGRLVAIGGGTFEEIDALNRISVELSKKALPNILFIGTALQDSTNPLTSCKKSFKRVCPGTVVKKLSIIRSTYTEEEMDALLNWADIIFVGGGNTAYMLEEWKKAQLDRKLMKIFEEDSAVISGISAGAICWFSTGYTDSAMFSGEEDWKYEWIKPQTAVFEGAFCPHYNDWKRSGFDGEVKPENIETTSKIESENMTEGIANAGMEVSELSGFAELIGISYEDVSVKAIALDDCAAFVYENGSVRFAAASEDAHAYVWTEEGKKQVI